MLVKSCALTTAVRKESLTVDTKKFNAYRKFNVYGKGACVCFRSKRGKKKLTSFS